MAQNTPKTLTKSDPLAAAARTREGESVQTANGKEAAGQLVREARQALPAGVAEDSALQGLNRDRLLQEASKLGITLGVFMNEDELRLVLEHARTLDTDKVANVRNGDGSGVEPRMPAPPVPMPPPDRHKFRGVPDSPSGMWRTKNDQPKTVSLSGSMTVIRRNALINARHYPAAEIQAIADCGIKLVPVADENDESGED